MSKVAHPPRAHAAKKPASAAKATKAAKAAKPSATTQAAAAAPVAEVKAKNDGFGKVAAHSTVPQAKFNDAVAPALNRAFYTLASKVEAGDDAATVASQAAREFAKSPEAMAAFKHALPYLEKGSVALGKKTGVEAIGRVATSALPLVADGKMVKAMLKAGYEVGGPSGRRLVGAALRGLHSGKGMVGAATEVSATAAKIAAKTGALGATATKGLASALPFLGNAVNIALVTSSLKALWDAIRDPAQTKGQVMSRCLHVGATVTGCFIPPAAAVATAIDVKQAITR